MKTLLKISTLVATVVAASALASTAIADQTDQNNFINLGLNGQYSFASKANIGQTSSKVHSMGYGVSAGYEYALTPSFRVGAEVGYEDLGKSSYNLPNLLDSTSTTNPSTPSMSLLKYYYFKNGKAPSPKVINAVKLNNKISKYQKKHIQIEHLGHKGVIAEITYNGKTHIIKSQKQYNRVLNRINNKAAKDFMKKHGVTPVTPIPVNPIHPVPSFNDLAQNVQIKESMITVLATADYFVNPNWDIIGKFGPAWVSQKNEINRGMMNDTVHAHKVVPYLSLGTAYHFENNMSVGVSYGHLFGSKINSIDDLYNKHKVQSVNSIQLDLGYTFPF